MYSNAKRKEKKKEKKTELGMATLEERVQNF
jgi:hypothetical protein